MLPVFLALMLAQAGAADRNPGTLKMALVNLKSQTSDGADPAANQAAIQANLQRHFMFVDKLAADGAEFVGFPELSVNGYHFSKTMTWLKLDGPEVQALQKKAAEKRVISTCADGSDRKNLEGLVANGAKIIYGPHANTTGGTTAGWYKFRAAWGGPEGWIAQLKVHAALHNHAGLYNADFAAPAGADANTGWASGAWFIGPDGATLAQMPSSVQKSDSREHVLIHSIPLTPQ
jgi:hypothetical protein